MTARDDLQTRTTGSAGLNHFDDFSEGREFLHRWGRTITEAEAVAFAVETLQHEQALFDREYARHIGHPDLVVSALLVYGIVFGLTVEDLSEAGGVFLGADEIRFGVPAYPGDTLYARSVVETARRSSKDPSKGIVTWKTTGINQRAETVVTYSRSNVVPVREA